MNIDWTRVAKPQADGYDVEAITSLEPHWRKQTPDTAITLCDGNVSVHPERMYASEGIRLIDDSTQIDQAWANLQTRYLSQWQEGYQAVKCYLDEVWPFFIVNQYGDVWRTGYGCTSGHIVSTSSEPQHRIYVSINVPHGCAQGVYHELGHLRLQGMGMYIETHDGRLILNGPDELYDSPVRFDVKRPMSAVIHGTYAWMLFTENDYQNHRAGLLSRTDFEQGSAHNFQKVQNGIDEIRRYARCTNDGQAFLDGLFEWADDLLARCVLKQ